MIQASILFVAAEPEKGLGLRLDQEVRSIREGLRAAHEDIQFDAIWAVRVKDLTRALLDHRPQVVHFSGHGHSHNILLVSEDGATLEVSGKALANLFQSVRQDIRLVILNTSDSLPLAGVIADVVGCAIGSSGPLADDAAIIFSEGFYRALSYGRSIQDSFNHGVATLQLQNVENAYFELISSVGVDPSDIFIVRPPATSRGGGAIISAADSKIASAVPGDGVGGGITNPPPPPAVAAGSEREPDANDFAWAGFSFAYTLASQANPVRSPDSTLLFAAYLLIPEFSPYASQAALALRALLTSTRRSKDLYFLLSRYGFAGIPEPDLKFPRPTLGANLRSVLLDADALRRTVARAPGPVSARHVLGALLRPEPGYSVQHVLEEHGYDLQAVRAALINSVQTHDRNEDIETWRRLLLRPAREITNHYPDDTPVYAGYTSDGLSPEDRLGVMRDVEALCSVLAARASRPPMSVGLFGDWGMGKSFFMERMRERIAIVAEASKRAEKSAYCRDVVQIWFNAWHYMDADLWANLAARIFEGLAEHLDNEDERTKLFSQLESSQGVLAQVVAERQDAERTLEMARKKREELERSLAHTAVSAFTVAVRRIEEDPTVHDALAAAATTLGIPAAQLSVETAGAQVQEVISVAGQVLAVLRRPVHIAIVALIFLSVGTSVWWVLQHATSWTVLGRAISSITAGAALVAAVLTSMISRIRPTVAWLKDLDRRVRDEKARSEAQNRHREEIALGELEELRQAERRAGERVENLKNEVDEMRAGRRLHRFILERNASSEYHKRLGVINLIRNDFHRLSELLAGTTAEAGEPNPQGTESLPSIDRIILYIDDLDRCPEDRVVEVLQAVHLMLAFPLFVVVVGVDSRWLLLSLTHHHAAMDGRSESTRTAGWDDSATPQNYLEKIFQIPFSLRPMNVEGFGSLVDSLLPLQNGFGGDRFVAAPDPSDPPNEMSAVVMRTEPSRGTGLPPTAVTAPPSGDLSKPRDDLPASAVSFGSSLRLDPANLYVESWERELIARLHSVIASPRGLKRFTNIYRFIRAQQGADELAQFRGTREFPGEFHVVALLLATLIGHPVEGAELLRHILSTPVEQGDWWGVVERLGPDGSAGERQRWRDLRSTLLGLRPLLPDAAPFSTYVRWAHEVARFSFQSAHILSAVSPYGAMIDPRPEETVAEAAS